MKPVPPDALGFFHLRDCITCCDIRVRGVKCRIEAGELWQIRRDRRHGPHRHQIMRVVQRRQWRATVNGGQNIVVYPNRRDKAAPAMNHPVGGNFERLRIEAHVLQFFYDRLQSRLMVDQGHFLALAVAIQESGPADFCGQPSRQLFQRGVEDCKFDRG